MWFLFLIYLIIIGCIQDSWVSSNHEVNPFVNDKTGIFKRNYFFNVLNLNYYHSKNIYYFLI